MKKQHPNQGAVYILFQQVEGHDGGAEDHQHHAGGAVQRFGFGLVGKYRGDPRPDQGEDYAQRQHGPVRRAPMVKWEMAPVSAVKVMMNTLVPTAVFNS